tara:strand:+ start:52 stop:489 length:438 start_codon:yes stop_codon:yes gene_type:complete
MSTNKYKKVKKDGKVYLMSSQDKGKTWSKPKLYNSKEHKETLKKEREQKKEALRISRPSPYQRKHGSSAEKKRIDSLAHLSNRQKRVKKRNIDAGTPGKSTTTSKKVRGRKLSPYEQKQADRKKAMQDRARARHEAWKESRKNKK